LARLYEMIETCHPAVIACVQGACYGGGNGLVAASDFALADEGARFCFSEVRLGLVPATISPFVMRKIGSGAARAYFSTGIEFDAATALRIGMVQEVHSAESIPGRVDELIRALLKAGPDAVGRSKRLAVHPPMSPEDAAVLLAEVRAGAEGRAGMTAFLNREPAPFVQEPPSE
ncbi:MAG: enoyl-CoA hydratase-related protein, partial [Fimbriimonadaceae bacterium]|nr:enoyl-CoA hydratase-related protein [Fimbriimonadaceae bacterium]